MQSYTGELTAGPAYKKGKKLDWLALLQLGGTETSWAIWQEWAVWTATQKPGQEHSTGVLPWLSGSWHSRKRNKDARSCHPAVLTVIPGVRLCSTLYVNPRTITTELLFPFSKGNILDMCVGRPCRGPRLSLLRHQNKEGSGFPQTAEHQASWLYWRLPWKSSLGFHRAKTPVVQCHLL